MGIKTQANDDWFLQQKLKASDNKKLLIEWNNEILHFEKKIAENSGQEVFEPILMANFRYKQDNIKKDILKYLHKIIDDLYVDEEIDTDKYNTTRREMVAKKDE